MKINQEENRFAGPPCVNQDSLAILGHPRALGACLAAFFALLLPAADAATLTTDKPDYAPGEYVTFTGGGWQPGETVFIEIFETSVDPFFDEGSVFAIADQNGNIFNSDFA